ncbi:hypothetical protein NDK43_06680 [Neobacillus pocheonensis]|uniref:Uncharacterized protein n=1 Tax=Neobacillus pocheonensis TaxID=363869 RepID=A0ABT0W7T3_9BACI|nr:hypothetical protein [Neobacillus pocheonensis]
MEDKVLASLLVSFLEEVKPVFEKSTSAASEVINEYITPEQFKQIHKDAQHRTFVLAYDLYLKYYLMNLDRA